MKQNTKRLLVCILAFMLITPCFTTVAAADSRTILYVSADGNDSNTGNFDAPFATLQKARDTIRYLKEQNKLGEGGAVVYIRGGEYFIQNALTLSSEDSGRENAPVIYRNYPGEKVTFTGGAGISADAFKKVTDTAILERIVDSKARSKVVEVDMFALGYTELPEQIWPGAYSYSWAMQQIHGKTAPEAVASELVVNGNAMTLARYPNDGYMYIDTIIEPGETPRNWYDDRIGTPQYIEPEKRTTTPFTITVNDSRVKKWEKANDSLITGSFYYSWADQTVPVAKIDGSDNAITSKYPSEYSVLENQHFYIYNLLEEIDIPGEYFVDRNEGKLYLYPPEDGINDVIYTTLDEYMFDIQNAEYITIKGIDMAYMRNGAVKMTDTAGCEVSDCDINYTGNIAIDIKGSNNKVYDCYIRDVNKGIRVVGGDPETLTHSMNVVENNHIERADRVSNTYSWAINFDGVGNYIYNNKLNDADHLVIQFGGQENVVAYNEIFDACTHADDMGAIYAGRNLIHRGNKILYNYIHDIGGTDINGIGVQGIFLDDWWSAANIEGNVFENIKGAALKFAGSYNEAKNNVFINCQSAGHLNRSYNYGNTDSEYTYRTTIAEAPYIYSDIWVSKYPSIVNVISADDKLDMNNYIVAKNNVLFNTPDFLVSSEIAETATIEKNVSFTSDPGFYDIYNKNYLLNENSTVYEKIPEFKPVLFTRMGNYSERALNRVKNAYVLCQESPYIMKKGQIINKENAVPKVIDNKYYIPVRIGVEAVGGELEYNEATDTVSITASGKAVSFVSGDTDSFTVNGTEYTLNNSIVKNDGTNYISVDDLTEIFDKYLNCNGNLVIISDTEGLFTKITDDGLLRYIESQLSVY